ncbi:hypothetical protein [Varibaculum cambriense]|uniref:Uncharacterized protein n=1 Tax=Varibaculum cambriense TaxID=184870 RepID=A0AAJ1EYL5_9ACTO|nr:hypothetical protein [Varibaculum cambriense]
MNNTPRRSKLAGLTPAKPGQATEMRRTEPQAAKAVRQTKITVRLDAEIVGRARQAWLQTLPIHQLSWAKWIETAIKTQTNQVELEHNNGRVYEQLPPGSIPPGPINSDPTK